MFLPRLTAKPMAGPVTEKRRGEEHRAGIESEVPKRGPAVIDILGREGYHLPNTSTIIVARSDLENRRM